MRLCPNCGATVSDKFAHQNGCPSISFAQKNPTSYYTAEAKPCAVKSTAGTESAKNGPGYPNQDGGFASME